MARPRKAKVDYFPFDSDFFSDRKIRRLRLTFGCKGICVFLRLICEIYRNEGYYIRYEEDLITDVAYDLGITENIVRDVINMSLKYGLFNEEQYRRNCILTSFGLQNRYFEIKRKTPCEIIEEFIIAEKTPVIAEKTRVIAEKPPIFAEITPQSKVKKIKEKESKERDNARVGPDVPVRDWQTPGLPPCPVEDILALWNEIWAGTTNVVRGAYMNGIAGYRLTSLWELYQDIGQYRTVFEAARQEAGEDGGITFPLHGVLTEANFARLLVKNSIPKTSHGKPPEPTTDWNSYENDEDA